MAESEKEIKLEGGNVSGVYRLGNTVRRELKPESLKIHKLLKHLKHRNFSYSPQFLGIDEKDREILSFIEGEVGNYPAQPYMWSDNALKGIAQFLRHYHDAVSDFPIDDSWQPLDLTPPNYEVLCHNDFAIYNLVFKDEKPVGIIDFDVAGPGPRLWDIAYALYTCVPISRYNLSERDGTHEYYKAAQDAARIKRRVNLFLAAYGQEFNGDYLAMVLLRLEGLCTTIKRKANEGDAAFQKMIADGHVEHYEKEIEFIRLHGEDWK